MPKTRSFLTGYQFYGGKFLSHADLIFWVLLAAGAMLVFKVVDLLDAKGDEARERTRKLSIENDAREFDLQQRIAAAGGGTDEAGHA